jgi:peptidoglycan/LPS O-acetylase OafA/YrhL
MALAGRVLGEGGQAKAISAPQVVSHFFYLQDLLGYRALSPVFWTLCLEIQFYLAFVVIGYIVRHLAGRHSWRAHAAVTIALFIVSLLVVYFRVPMHGWFVPYWYMFALGAATCWAVLQRIPMALLITMFVAAAVLGVIRYDVGAATAVLTSAAITAAFRLGQMGNWLNWGWVQFCGRISYSIYLLHTIVAIALFYRAPKFFGRNELTVWLFIVLATACSIFASWVMYRLVESPSIAIARRIAPRKATA